MVQLLDVVEKALNGTPISENDYQLRRFSPKVQEKVREYKLKYNPPGRFQVTTPSRTTCFRLVSNFWLMLEHTASTRGG